MAVYTLNHVDHGGNVWASDEIECDDDASAITAAHREFLHSIGFGFDLMEGERLVYSHRKRGQQS
jgi:hypothetical protein